MKMFGIAAGALVLVGAAATPVFAQSTPPSSPATQGSQANPSGQGYGTPGTTQGTTTQTPGSSTSGAGVNAPGTSATTPTNPMTAPPPGGPTLSPGQAARSVADVMTAPVRAPNKSFEIGVDAGYTQGFGSISAGRRLGDVAGGGGTLGVSLGYRLNPRVSVGVNTQLQGYGTGATMPTGAATRGMTAGLEGTYHISPYSRIDPHVSLGTGYRLLMESPAGTGPMTLTHGVELGKVEVGLDVRPSQSVAISPVLGADVNMFLARTGGGAEAAMLTGKTVNTFVFAGIKGRFDVGGTRETKPEQQVGRR